MTIAELRKKAESLNVSPAKMKKTELIHAIQKAESYNPCFGTSGGHCDNLDCCFLSDCLKAKT